MSSFVRRLEIRILRKKGYVRQLWKVVEDAVTKEPRPVRVKHGVIVKPNGDLTKSPRWPRP